MKSIALIKPKDRYRLLRERVKDLEYGSFNSFLELSLERSTSYVVQITNGVRSFSASEIETLIEILGLKCNVETVLQYFPPLGLEAEVDYISQLIDQRLALKFGAQA